MSDARHTIDVQQALAGLRKDEAEAGQLAARLERQNNLARQRERKLETRRKIIVGGVLLAEAKHNENIAELLFSLLRRRVQVERDRAPLYLDLEDSKDWPWHPNAQPADDTPQRRPAPSPRPRSKEAETLDSAAALLSALKSSLEGGDMAALEAALDRQINQFEKVVSRRKGQP